MPVIGVGKAARDIDRAAREARARAGQSRSTSSSGLPDVRGRVACASCGNDTPRADALFEEAGPVCIPCYGLRTAEAAAANEVDGTVGRAVRRGLGVALLWLLTIFLGAVLIEAQASPAMGDARGAVFWGVAVVCGAIGGLVGTLDAGRVLRGELRALGTDEGSVLEVASAGGAMVGLGTGTLVLLGLLVL